MAPRPPTPERFRARSARPTALAALLAFGWILVLSPFAAGNAAAAAPRLRLVSLNPSLTAIVERLGASDALVGIDDYSARVVPSLASRPRVGGLFDPNLEAIVALHPDHVLLVAGLEQEAHGKALRRLGLAVEVFENERYDEVLANIERLGALLGREDAARDRIAAIRATRAAVEGATRALVRPRTVIVLDRSPLYLVGGETFLDELLRAVGAENLGAEVGVGYPRGSLEWLVASAPALILDLSPQAEGEADGALAFWKRWPSLPAVASHRVLALDATRISLPGPDLDRALRELAVAVHGSGIDEAIAREQAASGDGARGERGRADGARDAEAREAVKP